MKRPDGSNKIKRKGIGAATIFGCFIALLIVVSLLESNSRASETLNLQPSFNTYETLSTIEGTTNHHQQGKESTVVHHSAEETHNSENSNTGNDGTIDVPIRMTEDLPSVETTVKETNVDKVDSEDLKSDDDEKPTLPTVLSEDTTLQGKIVVEETKEPVILKEEKVDRQDDGGVNQTDPTESWKTKLDTDENSEESTESESTDSENQEEIKPDSASDQVLPALIETEETDSAPTQQVMPLLDTEDKSDTASEKITSSQTKKSKLECDFTHPRADTCTMEGDVRILGTYSTVFVVSPNVQDTTEKKIRPYARKWEKPTMQMIREVNVKEALPDQAPPCTVHHDVPVVVFSTGGFVGNVFHDYTDILIPLFLAANQYEGKVQFAATDMSWWWIFKYLPMIKTLSSHPILNLDQDKNVHCFPSAQIGLKSHKPLGVDPAQSPNGYTMRDFMAFIRKSFSLKRSSTRVIDLKSGARPRLLILLRRGTRAFVNEKKLVAMAKKIGFRVVTADPTKTREFPKFAHVVNSCDVMLGVHGAGLANMLYLPTNATVIQILPWGDLGFVGRHDYGLPLPDMGLRYVEHEIKADESTLIYRYPKDHEVFTNPQAIHDKGWDTMYRIYLNEQNIMLNVDRFKGVLIDIYKSYVQ